MRIVVLRVMALMGASKLIMFIFPRLAPDFQ